MTSKMKFEIHRSSNSQWYFLIRASNGRILATSETYWNRQDAINAAASIIDQAGDADFLDMAA